MILDAPIVNYTFSKCERLCSATAIEELFTAGKSKNNAPLKLVYTPNTINLHQVVIVVPKRNFKRANARNLLKRRMREAYRLHKHELNFLTQKYNLALLFTGREAKDYATIETSVVFLIKHLITLSTKGEE